MRIVIPSRRLAAVKIERTEDGFTANVRTRFWSPAFFFLLRIVTSAALRLGVPVEIEVR